jgi:uncharacterized protein YeaO (DUF488 family)
VSEPLPQLCAGSDLFEPIAEQLVELKRLARKGPLTLVYAARDELHNGAVVLRDVLLR